jgi:hypothetical protein
VNPDHEQFYKEFFNGGSTNVARAAAFRDKNPIVAMLARNTDISTFVGRTFTTDNVQTTVQLKEAADRDRARYSDESAGSLRQHSLSRNLLLSQH